MWEKIITVDQVNMIQKDDGVLKYPNDYNFTEVEIPTGEEKN